jgi:hypothetical protein
MKPTANRSRRSHNVPAYYLGRPASSYLDRYAPVRRRPAVETRTW